MISLIPVKETHYHGTFIFMLNLVGFLSTYTDEGGQIIYLAIQTLAWCLFPLAIVYNAPVTINTIAFAITTAFSIFIVSTMLAMIFLFIAKLQTRLKSFNIENIELLDGMHEGLLILSKTDKKVMFCNKPSQKLLEGALQNLNESHTPEME